MENTKQSASSEIKTPGVDIFPVKFQRKQLQV